MFFHSKYGKIYYQAEGNGFPIVMIHGTPFSSRVWDYIKNSLSKKYKIYTYDLLGYGESEKARNVSLGVQNEILSELLDFWKIDKPNAVAHDFGGATLLRNIILNTRDYNKIILIDVVALSPWGSPFVQHVKNHEEVFNKIPDYIHKAIVTAYIKDAIFSNVADKDIEYLIHPWLGESGKKAFYRQIAQMDEKYTREIEQEYSKIKIPTKILWGENDNWIPIDRGRELHKIIEESEFVGIPNCNHLVQMDSPNTIIHEINDFFQER
ncbi:alpha/beta hydrolase [Marispirochaeta sp.]|uniref:alpha/beta fold hydrolase n=1 Tax=Marispirochaeta sp. TaxID=2038653 RepID=UPI0029C70BC8|nr:alpha/beta hydrolase [Marispirochaeta sp.]